MVQSIQANTITTLSEAEQHKLLCEWNATDADFPSNQCIHQLFEAQVELVPNAVAVVCGEKTLTYSELNSRANKIAHYLQNLGVGAEVPVAICVERSLDLIMGLLAILKAGGAYVPLDPAYPLERLGFMLEDAQVPVLLTQEHLLDKLPNSWAQVTCLDADWETIASESSENLQSDITTNNLAYIIYTSGSTGQPKGVEVEHAGLVNLVTWHQRAYDIRSCDRATQIASPAFDASVWEIWTYLTAGASLHIAPQSTRADAAALIAWLANSKITIAFLPTPLAETVLNNQLPPNLQLRFLLTGGDQLHCVGKSDLAFSLVNHYGPTENTVVATSTLVTRSETNSPPPIGKPIANTQVYILDSKQQLTPIGEPGELHLSGIGLARGYRNQPELTAEKFVPNPFSNTPDARLYKTGDLVRYLSDGNIEFLGRIDNQVKIRGFRIELGEIETALVEHSTVKQSVVIAREDNGSEKRLVGYAVLHQGQTADAVKLREFLASKLPNYMVPTTVVILDELPLTPNGKIDRRSLPAPESILTRTQLPRTPLEEVIAIIFAEVLEIDLISVDDNFFELGGHSLLATQILAKIYELLAIDLQLDTIFDHATVANLSEAILQNHNSAIIMKTAELLINLSESDD